MSLLGVLANVVDPLGLVHKQTTPEYTLVLNKYGFSLFFFFFFFFVLKTQKKKKKNRKMMDAKQTKK